MTADPNRSGDVADILLLGGGIIAVCGAFVAALFAVGIGGPPDDVILEFNGRVVGGQTDWLVAGLLATVVGTAGIFCFLRGWRGIQAQRQP